MIEKVCVPDIGDFDNVEVIEALVAVGDAIAVEQPLITLESDKATMDVPSPVAGVIAEMLVNPGDKVRQGSHIANVETGGAASESPTSAPASATKKRAETKEKQTKSAAPSAPDSPPARRQQAPAGKDVKILVPDIGDFKNVEIIEMLVAVGDAVAVEQSLLTLESDKATVDVPAPVAGVVAELFVGVGDKISEGDLIAVVAAAETAPAPAVAPDNAPSAPPAVVESAAPPPPLPPVVESGYAKPHAGPGVRRFARELGVDLATVRGSGRKGRILKEDVQARVKEAMSVKRQGGAPVAAMTAPEIDFRQFGEVEIHPLSRINKLTAANLHRNWLVAPHVTQFVEADITDMEEFRLSLTAEAEKNGYKMTPLAFLLKAAVAALREFPRFNSSLQADGEHLVMKKHYHVGVAVDTPEGLVVPVLRDVDRKGLTDLARELAEVSARARAGKLKKEEMQGGCFTISSLGGIGGSHFTPILNLPEAAILGVSRAEIKPVWDGKAFAPRRMLPLSLSYDHRIIDGAAAARFAVHYANLLGDIRRLAL